LDARLFAELTALVQLREFHARGQLTDQHYFSQLKGNLAGLLAVQECYAAKGSTVQAALARIQQNAASIHQDDGGQGGDSLNSGPPVLEWATIDYSAVFQLVAALKTLRLDGDHLRADVGRLVAASTTVTASLITALDYLRLVDQFECDFFIELLGEVLPPLETLQVPRVSRILHEVVAKARSLVSPTPEDINSLSDDLYGAFQLLRQQLEAA
jgi:hypothetical protein